MKFTEEMLEGYLQNLARGFKGDEISRRALFKRGWIFESGAVTTLGVHRLAYLANQNAAAEAVERPGVTLDVVNL